MENSSHGLCKVIVYDSDAQCESKIKEFCDQNDLVPLKSQGINFMDILKSNVDLGALFMSSDLYDDSANAPLYQVIHKIRPELPIILRDAGNDEQLTNERCRYYCAAYQMDEIDNVRNTINEHIFNKEYPNALIRGIEEITISSLSHLFPHVNIESSFPYLINDRIIYGELLSLIPLDSSWCRGYMMMQTDEKNVIELVQENFVEDESKQDFRAINDVLSEITNLAWGKIKNRFISDRDQGYCYATQVPIIVNHKNKYITFGNGASQLCFKYTLREKTDAEKVITLYQKFVFNLSWAPEKFSENQPTVDDFLASGELEFF
jgi:CheY-specific phosphatase CheX